MDNTIHTPLDALFYMSASFLHVPLLVALGALLYLAYRGLKLSSQLDKLQFLESLSSRVKDENVDLHRQLDKVTLERENLKDELKRTEKRLCSATSENKQRVLWLKEIRRRLERACGEDPKSNEKELIDKLVLKLDMVELNESHLTSTVEELHEEITLLKVCLEEYKERDSELDVDALGDLIEDALRDNITVVAYDVAREIHDSIVESFTRSTTHNK